MNRHRRVAYFLPYLQVTLRTAKPKDYAECPLTLGNHIKRKRKIAGLTQAQAAERIGVAEATLRNWECEKTEPPIALMPAVIEFLDYDPMPAPTTLSGRMLVYRQRHGISIKEAASRAGVDESSWSQWERTGLIPWKRYRALLEEFLIQRHRHETIRTNHDDFIH